MKTSSSLSSSTNEPSSPSNLREGRHNLSSSTSSRMRRSSRPSMPVPEPLLSPESSSVETSPLVDKGGEFTAPPIARPVEGHSGPEEDGVEEDYLDESSEDERPRQRFGPEEEEVDEIDPTEDEAELELDALVENEKSLSVDEGDQDEVLSVAQGDRDDVDGDEVGSKVDGSSEEDGGELVEEKDGGLVEEQDGGLDQEGGDESLLDEGDMVAGEGNVPMEPAEFEVMYARQELDMIEKYRSGHGHLVKITDAAARLETLYQGLPPNPAFELRSFKTVRRIALTLASDVCGFEEKYVQLGEPLPGPEVWDGMIETHRSSFELNGVLRSLEEALAVAKGKCARLEKKLEKDHLDLETSQSSDRREIEQKTSQLLEATSVIADLRSKVNQISLKLAATRTELDRAQEEVSALKEEVEVATDLHRELTSASTENAEEEATTELGLRDTRLELRNRDVVLEERDCEITTLKESLVTSDAKLAETIAAKSAEQLKISQEDVERLSMELATLKANYASLQDRSE